MSMLYALLSGEHTSIPYAELRAILEAEHIAFCLRSSLDQLVIFDAPSSAADIITLRAGYVKEVGEVLTIVEAHEAEDFIQSSGFSELVCAAFSSKPRISIRAVKSYSRDVVDYWKLFELVVERCRTLPTHEARGHWETLSLIFTDGVLVLGKLLSRQDQSLLKKHEPKRRPFSRPGSMMPKLCRAFINLSRAKIGEVMLDPFCGTGGFLLEAWAMGIRAYGCDISKTMVEGARLNLRHYGYPGDVVLADAMRIPFRGAYAIATDPPYGRSTITGGRCVKDLLEAFLHSAAEILRPHGYVAYASPIEFFDEDLACRAGLRVVERHYMRVHRALTRVVVVAKKC